MFLYMALGVIISKAKVIQPQGRKTLINLLTDVALPAMILNSFIQEDVSHDTLITASIALIVSAVIVLASWFLSALVWRKEPQNRLAVLKFAGAFSNAGYAGIPIVEMVFGAQGVLYASMYLIPIRILMWTLGISVFVQKQETTGWARWKPLLTNPALIVVFIGVPMMLARLRLPGVLMKACSSLGAMSAPLSMLIVGANLGDMKPRDALDRDALWCALMRLIAIPLIALGALKLLGVDMLLSQVAVTLIAMPAATNTAILAEKYGADYTFATKVVFISTILSLVTVPLLALLF